MVYGIKSVMVLTLSIRNWCLLRKTMCKPNNPDREPTRMG